MLQYKIEIAASVFSLLVSTYSYWKKSVTISGFVSMIVVSCCLIWNNGLEVLTVMFIMFASSSLLTKFKQQYKSNVTDKVLKKHGPRDAIQAICNLGVGFICFVFYLFTKDSSFILALLCSVAASNADSWASEIGVLSNQKPRLITTLKPCEPGISGGITLLGTIAGIVGSVFIALISIGLVHSLTIDKISLFIIVSIAGIVGFMIDSILGATIQVIYKSENGFETENNELGKIKSRGVLGINNDAVNFLSSFIVALLVLLLSKCSFF